MLLVAIVLAFCVAMGKAKTGYTFTFWGSVLGIGLICGILLGDVPKALLISAEIQAVYLGFTQSGGVIASDAVIATAITVPIVMNTGLAPEAGLALAIPVGALAANLNTLVYILNGFLYRDGLKRADKGDTRGITLDATLWPILIRAFVFGSVVFVGVYFGSTAVQAVLDVIPDWLVQGFAVAGGVLPILGFALVVHSINRSDYIPYFIIGFFVFQYLGITTMGIAIITVCLVLVKFFLQGDVDLSMLKAGETTEKKEYLLHKSDINRLYFRWWWFVEVSHNYEGMQALSFCNAMIPVLKKLYPDKEELTAALRRHIVYFNTNGNWGSALHGIVVAMEEEQAMTHAVSSEVFDSTVNGLKAGLMGPLAGMGDTIDWGTWNKIFISIGLGYAAVGSAFGVIFSHLGFLAITLVEGLICINLGYRLGSDAISALFDGGLTKKLTDASAMIGMVLMGTLASQYCKFEFAIESVQKICNAIAPNIVVLVLIFLINWIISKKTKNFTLITVCMIGAALILAFLGIV